MTNHKIGIANVNINRHGGKHNASNARENKVNQAAQTEQHWGGELDLASPEGAEPGENLHPGWHRDQHGCEHEKVTHPHGDATGEHMVNPDNQTQSNDNEGSNAHVDIAKQGLA